jgi:carbamoylphosphate synthase large subunit
MAYCEGSERSIDCVCYKGKLITALIRKKAKHSQVTEENPTLLDYARQLIAHFKLSGIINIQFKDFKGIPCILEINPRASAGSVMAYQANLNIMPLAVEAYLNKGIVTQSICIKPSGQHIARTHLYYTIDTEHDHGDTDDTFALSH